MPKFTDNYSLNTSNPRKYVEYQMLGFNYPRTSIDLPEPDSDPVTVIRHKATSVGPKVIVEDTSFDVEGADIGVNVRWFMGQVGSFVGRKAVFRVLLGVLEDDGKVYIYKGEVHGKIVPPAGEARFGFDAVFMPNGASKTLAEDKPNKYNARALAVSNFKRSMPWKVKMPLGDYKGPMQHTAHKKSPLVARVVSAHLKNANAALSAKYIQTYGDFREAVKHIRTIYDHMGNQAHTTDLWLAWWKFFRSGLGWAEAVIKTKAIPPKSAKAVELASRVFFKRYGLGKHPVILDWFDKNQRYFEVLKEAATWPERSESNDIFKVGNFTVHNTIGASPNEVEQAKTWLEKAVSLMSRVPLEGFKRMEYGDVFLVGNITRPKWVAWYVTSEDVVYVRPSLKGVSLEQNVKTVLHELGHRYWSRVLSGAKRHEWMRYHQSIGTTNIKIKVPEVGYQLPYAVGKYKAVQVSRVDPALRVFFKDVETGQEVGSTQLRTFWSWEEEAARKLSYPTIYAASSPEEHFCEALAMYAFGDLPESQREAFEKIFG